MIDNSGKPRRIKELEEALQQVENTIVKEMIKIPPNLAIYMGVIREALIELIEIRDKTE